MWYGPKARVKYGSWLFRFFPSWVAGFVVGRTIFVRREAPVSGRLLAHEYRHVMQFEKLGIVGFFWQYLVESIKHGYIDNELEIEARVYEARWREHFERVAPAGPRRLMAAFNSATGDLVTVTGGNHVVPS